MLTLLIALAVPMQVPDCTSTKTDMCAPAPTPDDQKSLLQASEECGLDGRTLSFRREPFEYSIHIERAFGDAEARIDCALARLPVHFNGKFGMGPLIAKLPPGDNTKN